jgi:hypothetical protein
MTSQLGVRGFNDQQLVEAEVDGVEDKLDGNTGINSLPSWDTIAIARFPNSPVLLYVSTPFEIMR